MLQQFCNDWQTSFFIVPKISIINELYEFIDWTIVNSDSDTPSCRNVLLQRFIWKLIQNEGDKR